MSACGIKPTTSTIPISMSTTRVHPCSCVWVRHLSLPYLSLTLCNTNEQTTGGEGPPLDASVVRSSPHCNVAVEFLSETQALMVALEHRYYGCHNASACPYEEGHLDLTYLSSRQAVEDVAIFHEHITKTYLKGQSRKWVSFGGSYPGMLASFVRIKHPELIHASIASSAPVLAKVDMVEYNDIAAEAYALKSVGGSAECREMIAKGHAQVGELLKTKQGREQIEKTFDLDDESLETHEDQLNFAGYGVAYFPTQGNDPACDTPACNIERICEIMTDSKSSDDAMTRLAKVRSTQGGGMLLDDDDDEVQDDSDLYWPYQTCTEFGFYQTCEVGSKCFFVQGLDLLQDQIEFCRTKWKIDLDEITENVKRSNQHYGGLDPNATRIFYPNGNVDPWHGLSILKAPSESLPVLMVEGASHHAWTHPTLPTDQSTVVEARKLIREKILEWLNVE